MAKDRTGPKGLVVGIDLIPAQPPRGVSTIQGNFLSPAVRQLVKTFVAEGAARKQLQQQSQDTAVNETPAARDSTPGQRANDDQAGKDAVLLVEQTSYIDAERLAARDAIVGRDETDQSSERDQTRDVREERLVDVSDSRLFNRGFPLPKNHTDLHIFDRNSGGPKRYVSTLAPNTWLHHPQLE